MERDRPALLPLITRTLDWLEMSAKSDATFGWVHNQNVTNFDFYKLVMPPCVLLMLHLSMLLLTFFLTILGSCLFT